jgi:hypothetical protein
MSIGRLGPPSPGTMKMGGLRSRPFYSTASICESSLRLLRDSVLTTEIEEPFIAK